MTSTFHRFRSTVTKLFVLLSLVVAGFATAAVPEVSASPTTNASIERSAIKAVIQHKGATGQEVAALAQAAQVEIKRVDATGTWAFGAVVLVAPQEEGAYPEAWLFMARQTKSGWETALEGTQTFGELIQQAPEAVMSAGEKDAFKPSAGTEATYLGMQLPWSVGASWYMTSGPHGWAGYDRPYSALDFAGGDQVVRASHNGYVYKLCSQGWLRVVVNGGWTTDYYHLWSNIKPADGTWIGRGGFLGYTGTDVTCGGSASGRHVHWALRLNGAYQPVHDKTIGGWTFVEGAAYGGYAYRGTTRVYPGGLLYNYGP